MTTVVWFNCCAGVAGDMLLAALCDAGASREAVHDAWHALGVDGYDASWADVQRCGVRSLHLSIDTGDHAAGAHPHRPARDVLAMIAAAPLAERVRERAITVYRTLAEVEGAIHGVDAAEVELHEVGALDSILDVVGVCAALESLGIDRIEFSPIAVGHGTVDTAHGRLPNPAPAVTRLFARFGVSTVGLDTSMELATPTGVAVLTALDGRCGPMPSMAVTGTGFGAGTADPPGRPNVVQAIVGRVADRAAIDAGRPARLVETNVDDVTGEVLAHTIAALLASGAHDAWATPIVMKKGRPAHTVHALCDAARAEEVVAVLIAETGTLGVRAVDVARWPQQRRELVVDVGGHDVRVKVGGDGRVKVEHDDAVAAAMALGRPLRVVLAEAAAAAAADPAADAAYFDGE